MTQNWPTPYGKGPFEDAFQGFAPATGSPEAIARQRRFQDAVSGVFARLNKTFLNKQFEFNNEVAFSIKHFLTRLDAIFTLNQDLLLEIHYLQMFGALPRWSSVLMPGMRAVLPAPGTGPFDFTITRWQPTNDFTIHQVCQPFFKLHGSSNWETETGERVLIIGGAKSGAIQRFPVLRHYHDQFAAHLHQENARLMVIGYGFQDEHINGVIEGASRERGLGTYLVDPNGRNVLLDPNGACRNQAPARYRIHQIGWRITPTFVFGVYQRHLCSWGVAEVFPT